MPVTEAPTIRERDPQPYVSIPSTLPMAELPRVIPDSLDRVFAWLTANEIEPAGPPFIRFNVIDMAEKLQIEIGAPIAERIEDAGDLTSAVLPGGRFASLVYTGVDDGIAANAELIDWAAERGLQWDRWDDAEGDAFACRVEFFLDGPDDDPDPANWRTEVAIKLA